MKENTKKIILYIALCFVTLFIIFVVIRIHHNRIDNRLSNSVVSSYLTEIKYEEIKTHIIEEPSSIIYVSNSSSKESIRFENMLKNVIKKYNLENYIVYININNVTVIDPLYQEAPEFIFYKDGEVSDIIDCKVLKDQNSIINIFKERSVIGD